MKFKHPLMHNNITKKDFDVVIPPDINTSYVSLIRRNNENIYSEVSRYILN